MLAAFSAADSVRIWQGRMCDAVGLGPAEARWRAVIEEPMLRLRRYDGGQGRPLLIVPAPIKRPYIWDLRPDMSVVRRCLAAGYGVFLVEWRETDGGLDEAADGLWRCLWQVRRDTGRTPVVVSHSLGGILAAIAVARWPEAVSGLVLVETPLHFDKGAGRLVQLACAAPPATPFSTLFGRVPGTVLDWWAVAAAPDVFLVHRIVDWLQALGNADAQLRHLLVTRWTLDEASLAGGLFGAVVDRLYREDAFCRGELSVAGRRLGPASVTAPLLVVADPDSPLVPPAAVLPFVALAASRRKVVWWYRPAVGAAVPHVGALVDAAALRDLWPQILAWVDLNAD